MNRRGNASGSQGQGDAVLLHHPKPQHVVNPRNLHSSPPPGAFGGAVVNGGASAPGPGPGSSADYQRFSSPPVTSQAQRQQGMMGTDAGYQRFSSPPNAAAPHLQHQANMYAPQHPQQQHQAFGNMQQQGGSAGFQGQGQGQQQWGQFPMMNDATAQMGMQFGRSAVVAGQEYVNKNITRHLPVTHLLHSFNVSNSYVINKLRIVLFPWRHRPWARQVARNEQTGQVEGYKPPRDDPNSPDMYIPVMALVTYILLAGVVTGSRGEFHPDNLGMTASKSLGIVFIEFCMIKLGTYLLNIIGKGTVVDLFSYSGYKFVGIIVALILQLVNVRGWLYWLAFTYVFCANAFFLLRSLRDTVLETSLSNASSFDSSTVSPATANNSGTISHAQRSKRIKFLFFIAVSQIGSMWYLIRV